MAKKLAKYEIPKSDKAVDRLAKSVLAYAGPRIEGINGGTPQWPDIPIASWMTFKSTQEVWVVAYAACDVPHLPSVTEAKNLAKAELRLALSDLLERGLLVYPRTTDDVLAMGFSLVDDTPTSVTMVTDAVDMTISNDPLPDSYRQIIHYKILGAASRSKEPYLLAVFQIYIQGPGDPPPRIDDDSVWSNDIINMKSPYTHQHLSTDVGKTCWFRARWQAKGGKRGPWTMRRAGI
jgi:hypothetical protein